MSDLFNPKKTYRQADIAALLSISDRQVRNLAQKGILPAANGRNGWDPLRCIHSYIAYKSQSTESGNSEEEGDDFESEEKRLEREELLLKIEDKRETVAMKRAKRVLFEKTYAPIEMLQTALAQMTSRVSSRIDSLPAKIKNAWLDMPPEALDVIETEIKATCNECADVELDLSEYIDSSEDSGPTWLGGTEEDHAGSSERVGQ